jgi:glycosyltransferase involved in cell wall biosynthesis
VNPDEELLRGSEFFDAAWYLRENPDVAAAGMDPLDHYIRFGARERRDPGPMFKTARYIEQYPELTATGGNPLVHFLRHGITEPGDARAYIALTAAERPNAADEAASNGTAPIAETEMPSSPSVVRTLKSGPKAVFVTHDGNVGGAPAVLLSVARWFQLHTDYDVRIVSMENGPLVATLETVAPTFVVGRLDVHPNDVQHFRDALREFIGGPPAFVFLNSVAAGGYCDIDPFDSIIFAYIHEQKKMLEICRGSLEKISRRAAHIFCDGPNVQADIEETGLISPDLLSNRLAFIEEPKSHAFLSREEKGALRQKLGIAGAAKLVVGCGVVHWRKQPEAFIRIASGMLNRLGREAVRFIWIGGGPDLDEMRSITAKLGLSEFIEFIGHRDDFRDYLRAADAFALTSIEDPFPLVCLEAAAASTPSVIFKEAGGMGALVAPPGEPKGGAAVPIGNEAAFAEALAELVLDDTHWEEVARVAHSRVLRHHTSDMACQAIWSAIRNIAGLPARVSVVVPNYNCGPYLQQRIDSIFNQTFKDLEILLLDDCSTDGSEKLLYENAAGRSNVTVFPSQANSGSVFRAWERGILAATGDYVWIAEADDWCEPDFLANILGAIEVSPGVRLAYGRSVPADANGTITGDYNEVYLDNIAPGRWRKSYVESGRNEVNAALGRANSIPNASAVLVTRPAAVRAIGTASRFRLAGDWAYYVKALAGGKIAYVDEAINYHRRHGTTVTRSLEGTRAYFDELTAVGNLVRALYGEHPDRDMQLRRLLAAEATRFGFTEALPELGKPIPDQSSDLPGILFGVGDLSGGGAQMFAVRFANEWARSGAPVVLFVAGFEADNVALRSLVSRNVTVVGPTDIEATGLAEFMRTWSLDLVVTGHWWADRAIGRFISQETTPIPWTIIMHGCYENVLSSREHFPTMLEDFARAEAYCDKWIWTADKNKAVFEQGYIRPRATGHVVNGYKPVKPIRDVRRMLGISRDALVFALASRAIEEKGWKVSTEAFELLKAAYPDLDVLLMLIGDGPYVENLREQPASSGVLHIPYTSALQDYIAASDVGLLPTWFAGESLPLVLIEFLAQGKPTIVTDVGMCAWAVDADSAAGPAGRVLSLNADGRVEPQDLASAMAEFVKDRGLSASLSGTAKHAFEKFDMDEMILAYGRTFREVLGSSR